MVEIEARITADGPEFLRKARDDEGLGVAEAARRIGVPAKLLRRAEGGTRPKPGNALRIADYYGVRPADIWPPNLAA